MRERFGRYRIQLSFVRFCRSYRKSVPTFLRLFRFRLGTKSCSRCRKMSIFPLGSLLLIACLFHPKKFSIWNLFFGFDSIWD